MKSIVSVGRTLFFMPWAKRPGSLESAHSQTFLFDPCSKVSSVSFLSFVKMWFSFCVTFCAKSVGRRRGLAVLNLAYDW